MPDRSLATLTVLTQQLPAPFRRTTPAEIVAFDLPHAHAFATGCCHDQRLRMDGDLHIQWGLWKARVDGVVDKLHHRIRRTAVVGEEGGGYLGRDALPNGDLGRAHGRRM